MGISPEEWGPGGPEYVGGYRLEFDMSWTELKDCDRRGNEIQMINKILDTSQAVSRGKRRRKAESTQKCYRTPSGSDLRIVPYPMLPELFWQIVIDFFVHSSYSHNLSCNTGLPLRVVRMYIKGW